MMNIQNTHEKYDLDSRIVFIFAIIIAIITVIPIVFPAFILGSMEDIPKYPEKIDIFEKGELFYPFITINTITILFILLLIKKKIPLFIVNVFLKIRYFDVSRKQALVIVLLVLDFYMIFTLQEVEMNDVWEDFQRGVKSELENFSFEQIFSPEGNTTTILLGKISMIVFGNYRMVPLLSSITTLFLVYQLTTIITKKQISGIIAMFIVLSSIAFLTFDTTITYPNFWIMFYLLSLITVYKFWPLSPLLFAISITAKPLPILFLPMTFFFIYCSTVSKKKKIFTSLSYCVLIPVIGWQYFVNKNVDTVLQYNNHEFWSGFSTIAMQFRFEPFLTLFLIPIIIGLFTVSKKRDNNPKLIMFLIAWMLLIAPIISGFTTYTNNTYRFIPLVIFFAIGIGVLFSIQNSGRSTVQRTVAVSPG